MCFRHILLLYDFFFFLRPIFHFLSVVILHRIFILRFSFYFSSGSFFCVPFLCFIKFIILHLLLFFVLFSKFPPIYILYFNVHSLAFAASWSAFFIFLEFSIIHLLLHFVTVFILLLFLLFVSFSCLCWLLLTCLNFFHPRPIYNFLSFAFLRHLFSSLYLVYHFRPIFFSIVYIRLVSILIIRLAVSFHFSFIVRFLIFCLLLIFAVFFILLPISSLVLNSIFLCCFRLSHFLFFFLPIDCFFKIFIQYLFYICVLLSVLFSFFVIPYVSSFAYLHHNFGSLSNFWFFVCCFSMSVASLNSSFPHSIRISFHFHPLLCFMCPQFFTCFF